MTQYERELMTLLHHSHTPHPNIHEGRCRVCDQPHPCDTNRACRPPAQQENPHENN